MGLPAMNPSNGGIPVYYQPINIPLHLQKDVFMSLNEWNYIIPLMIIMENEFILSDRYYGIYVFNEKLYYVSKRNFLSFTTAFYFI